MQLAAIDFETRDDSFLGRSAMWHTDRPSVAAKVALHDAPWSLSGCDRAWGERFASQASDEEVDLDLDLGLLPTGSGITVSRRKVCSDQGLPSSTFSTASQTRTNSYKSSIAVFSAICKEYQSVSPRLPSTVLRKCFVHSPPPGAWTKRAISTVCRCRQNRTRIVGL